MRKQPFYYRHSKVTIKQVLGEVQKAMDKSSTLNGKTKEAKYKVAFNGINVNVTSLRLKTFLVHGTTCSCCGLLATHFAIERNRAEEAKNGAYHLNLWGVDSDGNERLFTMDHTLAKSAGGADNLSNATTMCSDCNYEKSLIEQKGLSC